MPDTADAPTSAGTLHHLTLLRWALLALALLSLVMAIIGIFIPVLPTVPFLLLAAWAASRSSPRLERFLLEHSVIGPPIREWRRAGVVGRRAKWAATAAMAVSAVSLWWVLREPWLVLPGVCGMAAVLAWLWRRPETAPTD